MIEFSPKTREQNFEKFENEIFDLVIVGGGINGAGVARDAALRGMKVALVEASDYASGTSSRSSKLIHGGIRYLENLEFKLVFEALNERTKLFEIAPHLVHPLRFMIPLYDSSRVGMFKMGLGMWFYDALSLFQAPEFHERLDANHSVERMPILKTEGLKGSYIYSDAYMDDDRLVIETLRSANEGGAVCVNYTKATGVRFSDNGKFEALKVEDGLTKKSYWIRGRHMIGSLGPWTDEVGLKLFTDWKKVLRPTKGIHLTFTKDRLPLSSAVVMAAEKSDRIVFGIPRHEMVIVGTTDTDFTGSPSDVNSTRDDVQYLLGVVNAYFPGAKLTQSDIVSSYAGVRPLVKDDAQSEGKTSREHSIWQDERGMTFVAGGKYTTYRLMAHQVVEKALQDFSVGDRVRFSNGQTNQPLNSYVEPQRYHETLHSISQYEEYFRFSQASLKWLAERYGAEIVPILESSQDLNSLWQVEARHAIRATMCLNIVDFMTRRVPLFLADPQHGTPDLEEISQVFTQELGWSEKTRQEQIEKYRQYIEKELHWKSL